MAPPCFFRAIACARACCSPNYPHFSQSQSEAPSLLFLRRLFFFPFWSDPVLISHVFFLHIYSDLLVPSSLIFLFLSFRPSSPFHATLHYFLHKTPYNLHDFPDFSLAPLRVFLIRSPTCVSLDVGNMLGDTVLSEGHL